MLLRITLFAFYLCIVTESMLAEDTKIPQLFYDSSSPTFITRWAFRQCAQHWFEPDSKAPTLQAKLAPIHFDPRKVKPGDIIFARMPGLFFELMHPKIKCPYILLTHGDVDDAFKESYRRYLDQKNLLAWFGIHPGPESHPKFFPLPIGVIGLKAFYDERERMHNYFTKLRNETPKTNLLALNFTPSTCQERGVVKSLFAPQPFCCTFDETTPTMRYLAEMATCKFTLSPRGAGIDCYRTWEALLVGSIPIVRSSQINCLYAGLPIVIIQDWKQVTKEFLEKKYKEITAKKYPMDKLYLDYWHARIIAVQQGFLRETLNNSSAPKERVASQDPAFTSQFYRLKLLWAHDKVIAAS